MSDGLEKGSREEFIWLVKFELSKKKAEKRAAEEAIEYWSRALVEAEAEKVEHDKMDAHPDSATLLDSLFGEVSQKTIEIMDRHFSGFGEDKQTHV